MRRVVQIARFLLLGWKAIEFGASFVIATVVGVWSGLEPPFNYTLAIGSGLILFGVLTLLDRRVRAGWPAPWGSSQATQASGIATRADVGLLKTPGPGSPAVSEIVFHIDGTSNRTVEVVPGRRLRALTFIDPFRKTVRASELPKTVRWRGRKILSIKKFVPGAMTIDEYRSLQLRAELFYEDES